MRASASAGAPASSPIGVIGEQADLTYAYDYLGAGPETLAELADGKQRFAETLKSAERPLIIVGAGRAGARRTARRSLALAAKAAIDARRGQGRLERLLRAAHRGSRVGGARHRLRAGRGRPRRRRSMAQAGALDVLFLLGADEIDVPRRAPSSSIIGTHGDAGAHRADVILPGAAYTEKSGIYVNTEGRVQMANRAGFPPGDAREDWAILRALSDVLGKTLPFDSLAQLRAALFAGASASGAHRPDRSRRDAADIAALARHGRHAGQGAVRARRSTTSI